MFFTSSQPIPPAPTTTGCGRSRMSFCVESWRAEGRLTAVRPLDRQKEFFAENRAGILVAVLRDAGHLAPTLARRTEAKQVTQEEKRR